MLPLIIWAVALVGIVYFNAKFWGVMPDLEDDEEQQAKARNIAPCMPQTPIPQSHIRAYYRDWFLLLAVLVVVGVAVVLIFNAI